MNRTTVIIIGVVAAVAIAAVVIWMVATSTAPVAQPSNSTSDQTSDTSGSDNQPLPEAESEQSAQNGNSSVAAATANVVIENMAYNPTNIVVKKGGTVTWTNQDNMGHNVVSDNSSPAGGPPKTNDLISNGETYSFTFNTVGTFTYHCTPHPFMQGTVEVVE